ncbi:MAG: TlpA family protein disulfide reductase [Crocinitomicaceae bacterium]|nr:TlpA family protein disulfide reductase [Crocinitomicaceae bacterium]MBK8927465.1 TlpA family protein disulfide reductase [Crocinitomicaceae bacterium]
MKKLFLLSIASAAFLAFSPSLTDETNPGKKLPSVNIKDMAGNPINTAEVSNDGKPIVISFWATWCKPCKLELNTIAEEYETWQEETGVKLIAVSIDDQKTANSVESVVNAAGWEYDIWMDPNGEFKRALGVNNVPHTFLLDGEGNIVYSHNNFVPGDEEVLYEHVKEISAK